MGIFSNCFAIDIYPNRKTNKNLQSSHDFYVGFCCVDLALYVVSKRGGWE